MAIDAVNDKQKKALMSLILVPVWESIKSQGDDCKAKESKTQKHGTVAASGRAQDQQIERKYHGSRMLHLNNSDIVSHVALFFEMKTPFNCMIDKFATVETPVQTSTTSYAIEEIIRLNLGKLMRTEESVKLGGGNEGAFNQKTLHMNLLKWDGNLKAKLMVGRNLKRIISKSEAGVRKLLAYQHSFQNSNKDNPSGTAEEDLLAYILKKAWAASEYSSLSKEDRKLARTVTKDLTAAAPLAATAAAIATAIATVTVTTDATTAATTAIANTTNTNVSANGDDSDSDLEDGVNDIEVVEDILPPAEYVPDNDIVDGWIPDGWPAYIAYVCEFTRCTDAYLHMFTGDAYNLSRAGAKSRSATRKDKAKERTDARNIELGGGEVSGARGLSFDQRLTSCGSRTRNAKKTKLQFSSPAASSVVLLSRSTTTPSPFNGSDGDSI